MPHVPESNPLRPWLAALLLLAVSAFAEDEPVLPSVLPAGTPEAAAQMGATADEVAQEAIPANPCHGYAEVADPRWFDRAQGFFSQRACTPAIWFDRFFGNTGQTDDVATGLVRVIPSIQFSERDFTDGGVRVSARVNLPNLRNRFNLVFNDDDEENAGLLRGEKERPKIANSPGRETSAALRYFVRLADRHRVDIDVGLRGSVKFYTRARYTRAWPHSPVLLSRLTQSVFFRDEKGFGEITSYELERMLSEDLLLRWGTRATFSESVNGLELREGIHLFRQIDRRRAIGWSLAMTVDSNPVWRAGAYATSIRFRQQAFRPWLFFEVEPFVDAERASKFTPNPGIAFRAEIQFGYTGDKAVAAPVTPAPESVPVPEAPLPAETVVPGEAPAVTSPADAPTDAQ